MQGVTLGWLGARTTEPASSQMEPREGPREGDQAPFTWGITKEEGPLRRLQRTTGDVLNSPSSSCSKHGLLTHRAPGVSLQRAWAHCDLAFSATRTRSAAGPGDGPPPAPAHSVLSASSLHPGPPT